MAKLFALGLLIVVILIGSISTLEATKNHIGSAVFFGILSIGIPMAIGIGAIVDIIGRTRDK